MILVTSEDFDPNIVDWKPIENIILVNYGQPNYNNIKRSVTSIASQKTFNEVMIQAIFPPLRTMTLDLLLELARTYNQEGMVIFNGNVQGI